MQRPMKFQRKGVNQIHRWGGRALLADDMGLGKTFQSLLFLRESIDLRPAIIITPQAVKINWQREAANMVNLDALVLEGRKPTREQKRLARDAELIVINYHILTGWVPFLKRLNPQCVVIDEAQYIKNLESQRTQAVFDLADEVPSVVALSGTPLTNRPIELFPVLKLLRPDLCSSMMQFAIKYCQPRKTKWGWQYNGARNIDKLHKSLVKHVMIRRRKIDVLHELPSKTRSVVVLSTPNRSEYEAILKDFRKWLKLNKGSKKRRSGKATIMNQIGALRQAAVRMKMPSLIEWLQNFLDSTDSKIILGGIHLATIAELHNRFKKESVVVNGTVTGKKRQIAVDDFQNNRKVRMLLGNMTAVIGLNMTAADTVGVIEYPWTPDLVTQFEDRAYRIGQKKKVSVYNFVAVNTIEEHMLQVLQKKQRIINGVLDGGDDAYDLDIFDQLTRIIDKGLFQ